MSARARRGGGEEIAVPGDGQEEEAAAATARKAHGSRRGAEEEATATERERGGARAVVERFIVTSRTLERSAVRGLRFRWQMIPCLSFFDYEPLKNDSKKRYLGSVFRKRPKKFWVPEKVFWAERRVQSLFCATFDPNP
jgi:hypothetical protein